MIACNIHAENSDLCGGDPTFFSEGAIVYDEAGEKADRR